MSSTNSSTQSSNENASPTIDSTNQTSTWEDDFNECGLKADDKKILLTYIPDIAKCRSVEKIASAAFKVTTENSSYYILTYIGGENAGHIYSITTAEEDYNARTKLYPIEDSEPEITYEYIELDTLQCDYVEYYFYEGGNGAKDKYLNTYVEFDMSDYYEDWVKAIGDDYIFNAILTEKWSYTGTTPTDVEYTYLQIKFRSIGDVRKILNADLGWDKIVVRGKIRTFTTTGILIEGIEVVEITSTDSN